MILGTLLSGEAFSHLTLLYGGVGEEAVTARSAVFVVHVANYGVILDIFVHQC